MFRADEAMPQLFSFFPGQSQDPLSTRRKALHEIRFGWTREEPAEKADWPFWCRLIREGRRFFHLMQSNRTQLRDAQVRGLHQRHRLQVVPSADSWFASILQRDEQLGHRADEGVGEPAFGPDRALKMFMAFRSIANG